MRLLQTLRAPQDPNGNPRHLAVVYRTVGGDCDIEAAYNLGYAGVGGLPPKVRAYRRLPEIAVPFSEWRSFHDECDVVRV